MTTTAQQRYLRDVGRYLDDVPAAQRKEMLAELEANLAEGGPGDSDYVARYGDPRRFALELRQAAGLGPPRPHRPRRVALVVLGVLLATTALTGWVWALHYQPIRFGGHRPGCFDANTPDVVSVAGRSLARLTYDDAKPVRIAWTITNTGHQAVDVTKLIFPFGGPGGLISSQSVGLGSVGTPYDCSASRPEPVRPFRLRAGEGRNIILIGQFSGCEYYSDGIGATFGNAVATLDVHGITHTTYLSLDPVIGVNIPPGYQCPRQLPPGAHRIASAGR